MTRALLLLMISLASVSAQEIYWGGLCVTGQLKALTIVDKGGVKVHGTCAHQSDQDITLNASGRLRTIARDDIASVRLDNLRRSHCLGKVVPTAGWSLLGGLLLLGTPELWWSPVLIAGAPAILVGGTPFCAVYDGINRLTGSHKITII
jgi:hypothetical protein